MIKRLVIGIFVVGSSVVVSQNMRQNSYASLFSDHKANNIGDAITIKVSESSQASNNAETSAGRTSEITLGSSGAFDNFVLPSGGMTVNSGNDFSGSGGTRTSGMIRTNVSAVIDSILQNGNMRIRGSRKISINGEIQIITIRGFVRPSDIAADNSVHSHNISEAEIIMEGSGVIENVQKPGWFTKIFHWIF